MMDAQLEVKLIECLDALAQGEPVEQILARYPQEAAQLRPLLQTAAGLPALRMEPSEAVKMRSRQKFMAQADMLRRTSPRKSLGFLPRFATGFVAAGLVAIVLSTGAVAASGSALPGDPLYTVKRTVENVQLSTAGSPVVRDELQREFEQRRRDEANELLDAGREGEVEFTGPIESMQPNAWIVGGLVVEIDANTSIVGTPQFNRLAEVKGVTGPNGLRAYSVTIESASEIDETPEAEGSATPEVKESTETPAPMDTPEPTETKTSTGTPRPTRTPRATATPQPAPTVEPVEVEFTGSVQAIDAATWNIDGTTIGVNADTEIRGSINVGQRIKVKALRQSNGGLIALRIEPIDESGSGSGSSGGNDNQNDPATPKPDDNRNDNGNENQNSNDNKNENQNSNEDNSNENDKSNENDHSGNGN